METTRYENYPLGIVIQSNLVSFAIYGLGFYIVLGLGWGYSLCYTLSILLLEYRLLKSCVNCFYWGKTCGFGKGRLSALLFEKGDYSKYCMKNFTWQDMIPDILVSLIPFVLGIILLIIKFDFILMSAILLLVFLTTTGNGYIRGTLTCNYCKQKDLGCPAYVLFNKNT